MIAIKNECPAQAGCKKVLNLIVTRTGFCRGGGYSATAVLVPVYYYDTRHVFPQATTKVAGKSHISCVWSLDGMTSFLLALCMD